LISGGSGLVGDVLTTLLIEKGYKARNISRSSKGDSRVEKIVLGHDKKDE